MQRQKQEPNGNYFICDIILISDNYIFFSSFSSIYFVCLFALLTLVAGSLLNHANIINDFTFVFSFVSPIIFYAIFAVRREYFSHSFCLAWSELRLVKRKREKYRDKYRQNGERERDRQTLDKFMYYDEMKTQTAPNI